VSGARCYTITRLLQPGMLDMPRRTFFTLKKAGQLPFLEELKPRIGRRIRYRADLVDRYLAGEWGRSRAFASARKLAS
jgi:hypothetical protein